MSTRTIKFPAPATLLISQAALIVWGTYLHSPTLNEPGHLAAGISNWCFGRFEIYKVNPPLVRMVAAVPILASARTDWSSFYQGPGARPEFPLGEAFVAANGGRAMWLVALARWACLPFSLLGGWICYRWARELGDRGQGIGNRNAEGGMVSAESRWPTANSGRLAGLLALALWCFCPNILAHGALITPDMGATALAAAACYTFWRWLKQPTWWGTLGSGLVLGLAKCQARLSIRPRMIIPRT